MTRVGAEINGTAGRHRALAGLAALTAWAALTGCGPAEAGPSGAAGPDVNSPAAAPAPSGTPAAAPEPTGTPPAAGPPEEQLALAMLPDAATLPGWAAPLPPSAASPDGEHSPMFERTYREAEGWCEGMRATALVNRVKRPEARISFFVISYRDEKSAEAAYERAWKVQRTAAGPTPAPARLGRTGDRLDAVRGEGRPGWDSTAVQIRAGRALLQISAEADPKTPLSDRQMTELAAHFAERARRAQGLR
ncbi:hypothetical protein [Streptomyces sp. NPDC051211]|uniref:hypothetical protein n=1 Tax=Streptomyces sp. NPDC051211 TaxID=3154643 RepID=UPI00344DF3F7